MKSATKIAYEKVMGDVFGGGKHDYVSTYCVHGKHKTCRKICKICGSPCLCPCHDAVLKAGEGKKAK